MAILYEIITSAEQHPDVEALPFRAIFAAYDEILARHGLDPDHDQVYLRFLFRLGDKKVPGQSLYESFELLLEELGIQLEFSTGDDTIRDITRNLTGENGIELETTVQSNGGSSRAKDIRRASFDTLYPTENDNIKTNNPGTPSRASSSQRYVGQRLPQKERPATRASTRPTERTHSRPAASQQSSAAVPTRGRLTAQEFARNLQHYQKRNASASVNGDNGTRTVALSGSALGSPIDHDIVVISNDASPIMARSLEQNQIEPTEVLQNGGPSYAINPNELLYRPSETQLLRDAETFEHYRVDLVVHDIIRKWRIAAVKAVVDHRAMEASAVTYDKNILVRQGFEHWRARHHENKQVAEKQKFFDHLERRAGKARDLFLLTKAFTHWAECAYDEASRASLARRHILRLKYFNAWRKITVVNGIKVRRQGLRKFYRIWKQHSIGNRIDEANAASMCDETLLRTMYWRWFWAFCEKRAPQWSAARLKARYFALWAIKPPQILQREHQISTSLTERAKKFVLLQWLEKTRAIMSGSQQAISFHNRKLATQLLAEWRLKRQHAPLMRQVSNIVDWRVAGITFNSFVNRYRVERHAELVNRLRIMRNAWTQWNDRLRWQTLAQQISDRFVLEALYKWVIAERSALLCRLHAQRLKQNMLMRILRRLSDIREQQNLLCQTILHNRDQRRLRLAVAAWRSRLDQHRYYERKAFEFYAPRITQEALQVWNSRSDQIRQVKRWAKNARHYFLATKFLKRWRAAVSTSRRKKRRDAYAIFRRKIKIDLATEVISRWRGLTVQRLQMGNDSQLRYQERLLQLRSSLFDVWRTRRQLTIDWDRQADGYYRPKLAGQYLEFLLNRLRTHQELDEQAQNYAQLRIESVASGWLHKLRLQMIELKGRSNNADSIRSLYDKRYIHNLLKRWHAKTASQRGQLQPGTTFSTRSNRFGLQAEGEDIAGRAEEWTAFEDGFDVGNWVPGLETSTPLPGYLRTPSKRAARAKALVRVSTTPAGTPMQNRPKFQPTPEFRTGRQGALGRSVAFGAIVENEPKMPRS